MKKVAAWVLLASFLLPLAPIQADEPVMPQSEEVAVEQVPVDLETTLSAPLEEASAEQGTSTPNILVDATSTTEATSTVPAVEELVEETFLPEEVIVKLDNASDATLDAIEATPGITITDILADDTIIIQATSTAEVAVDFLENLPSVEYAEPSYDRLPFTIPTNDTFKDLLWAIENTGQDVDNVTGTAGADIDGLAAWNLSLGTSTTVAVIDSGVMYTHPDLANNMWDGSNCVNDLGVPVTGGCAFGYDFADNDTNPFPVLASSSPSHGTHVAGTIAAMRNNEAGIAGVAPSTKIMAIRFDFNTASEIKAIDFARENGVRIINASYGGTSSSTPEYDAIKRFTDAGGIFIAAAGNSADDSDSDPIYPAAYNLPGIISVAATDQEDRLSSFSNFGLETIDIGAPGVNIYSTYISNSELATYEFLDGTSMAAPHVAGTAALIKSRCPSLTSTQIHNAILNGGDAIDALSSMVVSGKRLNSYGALLAAGNLDTMPPIITLNGSANISLTAGDTYNELGATTLDCSDGATEVSIGGDSVNTSSAGTYVVTYSTTDTASNQSQVVRTVTVSAAAVVSSGGGGGGGGGGKKKSSKKTEVKKTKAKKESAAKTTSARKTAPKGFSTSVSAPAPTPVVQKTQPVVQTPSITRQLILGSMGTDVTALQNALLRAGVYAGPVTGYFGPMTQAAVRAYQTRNGLAPVGIVGPQTRAILNLAL